jgi:hypothetical protein
MTERKASVQSLIDHIKTAIDVDPWAKEMVEDLLKEQEAVEPKQIIRKQCKKEHEDGSIDYFAEWYCPHCNMLILRGFDNPSIKFCYKCGKPILWESR